MKEICKICNQEILEDAHFWKEHRIKMSNYYDEHLPWKLDLHTNERILFKSRERYYLDDFLDKKNMKSYLLSLTDDAQKAYLTSLLKRRKEIKDLIWTPTQVELRSVMMPSMVTFTKLFGGGYYDLCKDLGFKNKLTSFLSYPNPTQSDAFIYFDTREQKPLKFPRYEIQINKLDFGDYAFCKNGVINNIYVERKSLQDFISTISQGYDRFINEIERARAMGVYLIIAVEAPISEALSFNYSRWKSKFTKASPEFIFHRVRELLQSYPHIQFVFCKNREHMAELIEGVISFDKIIFDLQYAVDTKIL
jgi:hypothetical protein